MSRHPLAVRPPLPPVTPRAKRARERMEGRTLVRPERSQPGGVLHCMLPLLSMLVLDTVLFSKQTAYSHPHASTTITQSESTRSKSLSPKWPTTKERRFISNMQTNILL